MSNGSDSDPVSADMMPPPPPPPPVRPALRRRVLSSRSATAALAGGLVVGGFAGGYVITQAASSPSASASPAAPFHGELPGAGAASRTQDLQQLATALGLSVTQLQGELSGGKTIAAVAKEHNVSTAAVISALTSAENAEIDAGASSGRLTQAQATQLKTQTNQRVTALVNGTSPPFGGRHGFGGPPGGDGGITGEDQTVVAGAIGITTTQLQTELAAGRTIAAVAAGHNVAAATVVTAWAASESSEIDKRVASGQITSAQAAQAKAQNTQRVTDAVNGTRPDAGGQWGGPLGGPPPSSPAAAASNN